MHGDQIWENEKYVLKIEDMPDSSRGVLQKTVRAVIFSKMEKSGLRFLEFFWRDEDYVRRLIKHLKMTESCKRLSLESVND